MNTNQFVWRQQPNVNDVQKVTELVASTGVFSPEEIRVASELIEERLKLGEQSSYYFLFVEDDQRLLGYTCFGSIPFTDLRFDLYWIAVQPALQHIGIGSQLLIQTEKLIAQMNGRYIYADTSGRDDYAATRKFYERNQYQLVSRLENYYRDGDDKIIYCKRL